MKPSFVHFSSTVTLLPGRAAPSGPIPGSRAASLRLTASSRPVLSLSILSLALHSGFAYAQTAETSSPPTQLGTVEVRASSTPAKQTADIGGLSDRPLSETPQSVSILRAPALIDAGVTGLSGAIRSEPSVSDFYNTTGYPESLQIRGFLLDEVNNYKRDGMPVSSHTPFARENKERIEILKGLSGMQSGASSPGGIVNYVLKRPTATPQREVFFGLSERGTALLHGDFGGRFGEGQQFGYRVNAALEEKRPLVDNAKGNRQFLSGFFDWRLNPNTLVEAEFEYHKTSQPSVPGFSLLDTLNTGVGQTIPAVPSPRLNLNSQPWSLPFENRSLNTSFGLKQALDSKWLGGTWLWGAKLAKQTIRTNDRIAFPDGCGATYPGYCANGDFDVYDFRSENERRKMTAGNLYLHGNFEAAGIKHELRVGLLQRNYSEDYEAKQAYNWVGTGNLYTPFTLPADPTPRDKNTQRASRSTEVSVSDAMSWGAWSLWLGLRNTSFHSESVRTDGSRPINYNQSFTTPFAALGFKPRVGSFVYVSAGQGIETDAVPNRPTLFVNAGQALPAFKSNQIELGWKQQLNEEGLLALTLFRINKPYYDDLTSVNDPSIPAGEALRVGGARRAIHQGLEASYVARLSKNLSISAQATYLDAKVSESVDPSIIGKRTQNTAPLTAALSLAWQVPQVSGLTWTNRANYSGAKAVTRDNSVELPSYWQLDSWIAYKTQIAGKPATWRAGVDNVFDRRYWKDAPTQYWGGTYLFPALPRTFRVSLQMSL
jgi:iron complex outermembrane recepter protein